MKTPTKSKLNQAFSLVELLVVIAVIAVIAAIAIPNITGITSSASKSAQQRTAQNLASLASAAVAAGQTNVATNGTLASWISALSNGITVYAAGSTTQVLGTFKADAIPADTNYQTYLSVTNGLLTYNPTATP